MSRRNDPLIHLTPIKAQAYLELHPTDVLIKMSLLLTFILKAINVQKLLGILYAPPPPLLFKLLIYNTLTRKGFDPSTQIITQNFTTNWFIKIMIQTLKDDNMFGFFFQRVGRDQGSIPFWVIYFIIFLCIYPVHYSNLKLITAL